MGWPQFTLWRLLLAAACGGGAVGCFLASKRSSSEAIFAAWTTGLLFCSGCAVGALFTRDEPAALIRRWFRFSLRTFFLLVTVCCIGLGSLAWPKHVVQRQTQQQVQLVQDRQAAIEQIKATGGTVFVEFTEGKHSAHIVTLRPADYAYEISAFRKSLGDRRIDLIRFDRKLTPADRRAIKAIPEAEIEGIP